MDLLAPTGLALGALAVPLTALYFLRIRRRRVRVSSLMPWQAAQQSDALAAPFHRFRRRMLLWLQLGVLALLTLALARPAVDVSSVGHRKVMLLVDNTASMGATDVKPSRLDEAKRRAEDVLDGLEPADEAMLVEVSHRTQVQVGLTRDRAEMRAALSNMTHRQVPGSWSDALQLVGAMRQSEPELEVHVFTDRAPRSDQPMHVQTVGVRNDNVGITAMDLRRSPVNDLQRQLFLTVVNAGPRVVETGLEVFVDDRLLHVQNLTLPPGETQDWIVDVDGSVQGWLRATLSAPDDILAADDEAWAFLDPPGARKVVLVGSDPLAERLLRADPRVQLTAVAPEALTPELLQDADCVLFAAPLPASLTGVSYAVLGPLAGSPVAFGEPVAAPSLLDWRRTHPVMRFVNPSGAVFSQLHPVTDAAGLTPLARTDRGPLILAGEHRGSRVVQLAFDPYTSDLPLRVAWPVLLMNTIGWLTESDGVDEGHTVQTGQTWSATLPSSSIETVRLTTPDAEVEIPVYEGRFATPVLDRVGPYTVQWGSRRTPLAASLLDEDETRARAGTDAGGETPNAAEPQRASTAFRRELWRPLLWAMLALMLLEWWAFHRRRFA